MTKREARKVPDIKLRPVKYLLARKTGKSKKQSALAAGYRDDRHVTDIENTEVYKEAAVYYRDEVLNKITLEEIAIEQVKVIKQDGDLGAKNVAIKNVLEKIEPDKISGDDHERVIVVLKGA